jgi:hypothetical protein
MALEGTTAFISWDVIQSSRRDIHHSLYLLTLGHKELVLTETPAVPSLRNIRVDRSLRVVKPG